MVVQVILFIVCVLFSAFFSSAEISYSSVNLLRLKKEADNGNKTAARALRIAENYDETMYMILFGNNFVNIGATTLATLIGMELFKTMGSDVAATVSSVSVFIILLTFGEVMPKSISLKFNYGISKAYSIPIRILYVLTRPIIFTVNKIVSIVSVIWKKKEVEKTVTDEELIEMVDTIEEEGFINEKQGDLIRSAIDFCDTAAFEIMTPRVDVFAFDIEDSIEDLLKDSDTYLYSRIPVYEESIDNIIGVMKTTTLLKKIVANEPIDVRSIMQEPIYVHKSRQISTILKEFKDKHNHIAIIKDEFGGTMGIITMEDIIEELVGDIWDEMDEIEEDYKETEDGVYIIDGTMNIDDFFELVGIDEEIETDYTTIGGWCIETLERFAKVGDTFDYKNLIVKILKVDEFTVEKVLVKVEEKEDED